MSIARRTVRGAVWTVTLGVAARGLGLLGVLALTHFIPPAEYGEVAASVVVCLSVVALTSLGFPRFLIARKATPTQAFQAAVVQTASTAAGMMIVVLSADHLAALLGLSALPRLLPGMALAFLVKTFGVIPLALLARALAFRTIATANALGECLFIAVALATAPAFGGMAIVFGNLARFGLTTLLYASNAKAPEWLHPSRPRFEDLKEMTKFGAPLAVTGWSDAFATRWDNLLVAKLLGPVVLGHYNLAYNLAHTPVEQIGVRIGDVLFPAFAKASLDNRTAALRKATSVLALVLLPAMLGLAAIAPELANVVLPSDWRPTGWMTSLLVFMSIGAPVVLPALAVLTVTARSRTLVSLSVLRLLVILGLLALLGWLGAFWACAAVVLGNFIYSMAVVRALRRSAGIRVAQSMGPMIRPLVAALGMMIAVVGIGYALDAHMAAVVRLGVQCVLGVGIYASGVWIVARPQCREMLGLLGSLRRGAV